MTNTQKPHKIKPVSDFDGKKARVSRPKRAGGWCEPVGEPVVYWSRSLSPEHTVGRNGWPRYRPPRAVRWIAEAGWYRVINAPDRKRSGAVFKLKRGQVPPLCPQGAHRIRKAAKLLTAAQ